MKPVAAAVCREQRRRAGAFRAAVSQMPPTTALSGPLLAQKMTREDEARLARHLTALHLPHALSEHTRLVRHGTIANFEHRHYLLRLAGCEVGARERRRAARLIRAAGFPGPGPRADSDVAAAAALDDCGYIARGENVIALGGGGAGKTQLLVALGQAACRRGLSVRYATAAALVEELTAAYEARRLLALYRGLDRCRLLIVDDLDAAPLSPAGAALLFEVFSRRSERASTIVASRLPPLAWSRIFGSARLSDAVVERLAWRLHRFDLGGVDPAAWAANDAGDAVWRATPLAERTAAGRSRRSRRARLEPARSA
ncbi:MAG TPA: ATP-binding protein [Stellaceae bacterium]|nr:ATP-binding protein [Stellaceae bacterium]